MRRSRCSTWVGMCLAVGLASPFVVVGQAPPVGEDFLCEPEQAEMSPARYLRALSLHLRGVVPAESEYAALSDEATLAALIDEWLLSDAFTAQVIRRHRSLLWNNVSNTRVISLQAVLSRTTSGLYYARNKGRVFRGDQVPCDDVPADIRGGIIQYRTEDAGTFTRRIEGWVLVEPYWAPGTTVKVCAFDAQESAISTSGTECLSDRASVDPGCGCGPNLERCADFTRDRAIRDSIGEEIEVRIGHFFSEDDERPYHELYTERRGFVNGVLAHYWRHQVHNPNGGMRMIPQPVPVESFEAVPYEQEEWEPVVLGSEHSGLLTSSAFLLRFQTNRARASRFYDAILCEPFQPPSGGIAESASDEEALELDLQRRAGCRYCHAQLEPAAARWGRWVQLGGGYLDPAVYPPYRDDCYQCALGLVSCSTDCQLNYVTRRLSVGQAPYFGMLQSYEFRREEHQSFVEDGPARLVHQTTADGRFPACTARRTAEWLLGREIREDEQPWLDDLTFDFVQDGMRYRDLVRAIVVSQVYRRVR